MKVDRQELTGTCASLLATLADAHASDKEAEKKKNAGGAVGCLGCAGLFLALPLLGIGMDAWGSPVPGVLLGLGGLVAAVWGWKVYSHHSQYDLDDHKLATIRRTLELLQVDVRPEAAVKTVVDFRPPNTDPFLQHKESVGSSYFGDVMAYQYRQTWLCLEGRLLDGTAYSLEVERFLKSKVKPKKKGRRKVNSRLKDRLVVQLRTERYPEVSGLLDCLPAQIPGQLRIRALQAQGDKVRACFETPQATRLEYRGTNEQNLEHLVSGDSILGALVYLYRGLKQLKGRSVGGEGA